MAPERSHGPITTESSPGTRTIDSTDSRASRVSIMTATNTSRFAARTTSASLHAAVARRHPGIEAARARRRIAAVGDHLPHLLHRPQLRAR